MSPQANRGWQSRAKELHRLEDVVDAQKKEIRALQKSLSQAEQQLAASREQARIRQRELEEQLIQRNAWMAGLERQDQRRKWELQVAATRATSLITRLNSLARTLLALVVAVENDRADDEAYWTRLDEATRQARWLLESEYRIAKAGKEAA